MKNLCIFAAGFLLAALCHPLSGQHPEQIEMQTLRLKEKLMLTPEQADQVREIFRTHDSLRRKDEEKFPHSRRDRFKSLLFRMESIDRDIEKLLTKEQKKKFEAFKDERRIEMRERMKERQL